MESASIVIVVIVVGVAFILVVLANCKALGLALAWARSKTRAQAVKVPNISGTRKDLGQILVAGGFIKPQELDDALEVARRTNRKLSEVLVEMGLITPETLATALSFQLGLPVFDLNWFPAQPTALELILPHIAKQCVVLPLWVDGDTLTVAMDDPENLGLVDTLSVMTKKHIQPVISLHGGLREAIEKAYSTLAK